MNFISINQKDYIQELLDRFNLSEAKGAATPMVISSKFDLNNTEKINVPFQQLIALMYLVINSRPDIAFVTS